MSDESVIVKGNGTIFLGGPPLVKVCCDGGAVRELDETITHTHRQRPAKR
jgi:acetyl-CoA carboxylase carboxyltransferase component